jgi:STE24 endopeptidase
MMRGVSVLGRWAALVGAALLAGAGGPAAAQEETGPPGQEPAAVAEVAAPAGEEAPFDPEAATRAYLGRLSPEERTRSDAYFEGGYWLQLWSFLVGLGIAWLLLGTRSSARMRDLAARLTRRRPLQTWLYSVQYVVVTAVLGFPLAVYAGFVREHQYGLATQGLGAWLGDRAKGLAVALVLFPLLLVVLYGVFRRAPRTWWLWGTGVALLFVVLVSLVAPVYIDPLFNTYEPLADERVREPILSMARSSGIDVDDVYEFDASRQTTRISANVSGFLGTMRIRLNDNLLDRTSLPEIEAVMGHEIGHYVLNHVYESIVFFGVVLVGGFGFLRWAFDRVVRARGSRWGVAGIGDPAGLPLLAAVFSVYFFALTPVLNTYIRVNEAEADIYGLQTAREPDGFAEVALKLGEYRKLDPGPVEEWIFFDHPSGRARIRMAMDWKAENLGR